MVSDRLKSILLVTLVSLAYFVGNPLSVSAEHVLHSIDVHVTLQEDGTAQIEETWEMTVDEGTEIYKPMAVAESQSLENFTVAFNDEPLTSVLDWDVDASFEEKAGTYGQNDGELNWGVTDYGNHRYRLTYEVTNFVAQTQTDQMIYWKFINDNMDPAPQQIAITLASESTPFNYNNNRLWAFGFAGQMDITDNGEVVAQSSAPLSASNYATLLVRIPANQYPTDFNIADRTFDSFVEQAFEGSEYNFEDYDPNATYEEVNVGNLADGEPGFFDRYGWYILLGGLGIAGVGIAGGIIYSMKRERLYREFYPSGKTLNEQLEGQYYREPPGDDVFQLYQLLEHLDTEGLRENFLTASFLYLIRWGYLEVGTMVKDSLFQDKEELYFRLTNKDTPPKPVATLYDLLSEVVPDEQNRITQDSLKKYISNNYENYKDYMTELDNYSRAFLEENNLKRMATADEIAHPETDREKADVIASGKGMLLSDEGMAFRDNMVRFKHYLEDFSLLNERRSVEVTLWDDLMIYAGAFGILETVEEEFNKLYPEYREVTIYSGSPMIYQIYLYSHLMDQTYASSDPALSGSSGYGNSASIGGGGGSFGGGSGGGVR